MPAQAMPASHKPLAQVLVEFTQLSQAHSACFSPENQAVNARNQQHFAQLAAKKARAEQIAQTLERNAQRNAEERFKSKTRSHQPAYRISRTKADEAFSLCVRLRANCSCERCHKRFHPKNMKELHCSHNYSRETKQLRHHPDNAFALCQDCHRWFSRHKTESTPWMIEKLGQARYHALIERLAESPPSKAEEFRITAYYNLLARQLWQQREQGNQDYLAFEPVPDRLIFTERKKDAEAFLQAMQEARR